MGFPKLLGIIFGKNKLPESKRGGNKLIINCLEKSGACLFWYGISIELIRAIPITIIIMSGQHQINQWIDQLGGSLGLLMLERKWDGNSEIMRSITTHLNQQYASQLQINVCDLDAHPDIAQSFQICELPTILLFMNGKILGRFQGLIPRHELADQIQSILNSI